VSYLENQFLDAHRLWRRDREARDGVIASPSPKMTKERYFAFWSDGRAPSPTTRLSPIPPLILCPKEYGDCYKKLGGLGKLSQFSGIKSQPPTEPNQTELDSDSNSTVNTNINVSEPNEKLVTVNIKIKKTQKDWLTETAAGVRDNNTEPVPPSERVYPQHLIGMAIDLLRSTDIDWQKVRNTKDLQEQLNL
jgi:hypothetical protein